MIIARFPLDARYCNEILTTNTIDASFDDWHVLPVLLVIWLYIGKPLDFFS